MRGTSPTWPKHVGLCYCLDALKRKEAGFFVMDTHAGRASTTCRPPKSRNPARRSGGIQRLIETSAGVTALAGYFTAIRARRGKRLARYPGSPALIAGSLRPQDRALFVELMPAEARAAEREIESEGRVRTEIGDGYAALNSFSAARGTPRTRVDRPAL